MKNNRNKTNFEEDEGHDRDYLRGKDLSSCYAKISRDQAPRIDEFEDNFKFMQIDADYYTKSH